MESARVGKKLDKKAHKKALELHAKMLAEDPEYKKAWEDMLAAMFTSLADSGLRRL